MSVPPRIHIFLWLLSNNKLLTRDNLSKRRDLSDKTCLFCTDSETIHHLFESVARWWISDKRNLVLNYTCAAVLWTIWNLHNGLCFQGQKWRSVEVVLSRCAKTMRRWRALIKPDKELELEFIIVELEKRGAEPARIAWSSSASSSLGASRSPRHRLASRGAVEGGSQEDAHDLSMSVTMYAHCSSRCSL